MNEQTRPFFLIVIDEDRDMFCAECPGDTDERPGKLPHRSPAINHDRVVRAEQTGSGCRANGAAAPRMIRSSSASAAAARIKAAEGSSCHDLVIRWSCTGE